MALFANANRNPKKAGKFKVSTFLPEWLRPRRIQQTWQSIEEKLVGLTRAWGGTVEDVKESPAGDDDKRRHRD